MEPLQSSQDKTTMEIATHINVLKKEIIILIGTHLHGRTSPSSPTKHVSLFMYHVILSHRILHLLSIPESECHPKVSMSQCLHWSLCLPKQPGRLCSRRGHLGSHPRLWNSCSWYFPHLCSYSPPQRVFPRPTAALISLDSPIQSNMIGPFLPSLVQQLNAIVCCV